jgi:hypothetical protein
MNKRYIPLLFLINDVQATPAEANCGIKTQFSKFFAPAIERRKPIYICSHLGIL